MKTIEKWKRDSMMALKKLVPPKKRRRERLPPEVLLAVDVVDGRRTVNCSKCNLHLFVPESTSIAQPRFRCICGMTLMDPLYHPARDRASSGGSTSTVALSPRLEAEEENESEATRSSEIKEQIKGGGNVEEQDNWCDVGKETNKFNAIEEKENEGDQDCVLVPQHEHKNEDPIQEQVIEEEWVFVAEPVNEEHSNDEKTTPTPNSPPPIVKLHRLSPGETWVDEQHFQSDEEDDNLELE